MRIISPFRDYYDSACKYDGDHTTLYLRKPLVEDYSKKHWPFPKCQSSIYAEYILGFCGKVYPYVLVDGYILTVMDDSNDWMEKYHVKKYNDWIKEINSRRDNYLDFFRENASPIFVAFRHPWHKTHITFNCSLREFDFVTVFDPWQAYQEVRIFVENLATPAKPVPVMSDLVKAESHGYNKYSFRKDRHV